METARITLVKKRISKILKPVLKDYGDFRFYDSPVQLEKEQIPCVLMSSSGPSRFEEEQGILAVKANLSLDIFCLETSAPKTDLLVERIILNLIKDESCNGLVQKISIKETSEKSFNTDQPIRALLFDFEILYHLEVFSES